ncbi:MAG: hypothetical protein HOM34_06790 [Planctomycetes bacterium]|nr:hypothetical protein [Planctomycetota bacterium]MBT4028154.1 hypothetical protein [Planctomycetota bacterium]MBT4560721.1 hypothetical protein [Planctomycetota bacterium]MBT5101819.1 hypothetical protein [Planctomycetota bacterium]MBT5120410.1 hypothetical protein [Planctomycetota bacterium]
MFLLPGAERYRRFLYLTAVLTVVVGLAWWPQTAVETVMGHLLATPARLMAAPAGRVATAAQQLSGDAWQSSARPGVLAELATAERRTGQPASVPSLAWLEVPVFQYQATRGSLILAAGHSHGLAIGQPVVFGNRWLGRVVAVSESAARVSLWQATNERTGVSLHNPDGSAAAAVSVGRGASGLPVVRWLAPGQEALVGAEVFWRPLVEDPPAMQRLGLKLGFLVREGDADRGEQVWAIASDLPSGAEGRVWVAAGAVGHSLVAEPPVTRMKAWAAIPADAVFGQAVAAYHLAGARPAAVIAWAGGAGTAGSVIARVVKQRGSVVWAVPRSRNDWNPGEVVLLRPKPLQLLSELPPQASASDFFYYTRGSDDIPRGLPLFDAELPSPPRGLAFEALTRVSPPEVLR